MAKEEVKVPPLGRLGKGRHGGQRSEKAKDPKGTLLRILDIDVSQKRHFIYSVLLQERKIVGLV